MGDFIVQRSDGTVTYNLAVVVDDVTMEITHVIRGDDHISNTPKQVVIYEALGAPVPEFLHMPLLFGTDKKKLSKRHGATKLEQLTAEGFLVEVVRNYLCFLSAEFDETHDHLVAGRPRAELRRDQAGDEPEHLRPGEAPLDERPLRARHDRRVARRTPRRVPHAGRVLRRPGRRRRAGGPGAAGPRRRRRERRDREPPLDRARRGAGGAHARGRAAGAREDRGARRLHPHGRLVLPAARVRAGGARAAPGHGGCGGDPRRRRRRPPRPRAVGRAGDRDAGARAAAQRSSSSPKPCSPLSASA